MIYLKRIFPECCADTLLVQLVFKMGLPAHYGGISKVATALEKWRNDRLPVIGVVDNDKFKNVPPYLRNFKIIADETISVNLTVLKKENTEKYIIRIHPAFEKWIWGAAESCGVNPAEYGFASLDDLKNKSKTDEVFDNIIFKKFLNAIIQQNPPAIQILKYWLDKANT